MTEIVTQNTEVATTRLRFGFPDDYDAATPGDWAFIVIPLLGIGAGLLLRSYPWWLIYLLAFPIGAVFVLIGMKRPAITPWWSLLIPSGPQAWKEGLVEIACNGCGRGLDWATPDFAERPVHLCPTCVRRDVQPPNVIIPEVGK